MSKIKLLCDRCKREFEADEEKMNALGEVLCDDCLYDRDNTDGGGQLNV